MGKITINELSNSLTDYMDEKLNTEEYSLMTENKTIVGAINEIYGKQLIADTIGEPLSSSDTFSAMSNDINGLLSTFKTNMMNSGVTVESGDKFKQLIDKIATLTDNEGKGIQFVEFTTSVSFELNYTNPKYLNINGDYNFKPTHIILNFTEQTSGTPSNHQVITLNTFPGAATTFFSGSSGLSVRIESTEIGSVKLWYNGKGTSSISSYRGYYVHCYLFGVGEEDTTLRDSLASILEDEGVDVTEEDDMASLIGKVDEEFDNKNITDFSMGTQKLTWTVYSNEWIELSLHHSCGKIPKLVSIGFFDYKTELSNKYHTDENNYAVHKPTGLTNIYHFYISSITNDTIFLKMRYFNFKSGSSTHGVTAHYVLVY